MNRNDAGENQNRLHDRNQIKIYEKKCNKTFKIHFFIIFYYSIVHTSL